MPPLGLNIGRSRPNKCHCLLARRIKMNDKARIRAALEIVNTFRESDPSSRFCKELTMGKVRRLKKILEGALEN